MRSFSIIWILVACFACNQSDLTNGQAAIEEIMAKQEIAWNNGDLEGFMQAYWQNDSVVFIGSRGLTYGWNTVLSNYQKSYPDRSAMGQLTFQNERYKQLDDTHYWVAGKWTLHRSMDTLSGHYTLVWKRINGTWVIVTDHSS